ncbi:MAG: hypothetical protein PIR02_11820 [Microbacterium enclense]
MTTAPVVDDDWSVHYAAIDAVPGAFLVADEEEPHIIFPVDADSPLKAATFVEGLSQVVGFEVLSGTVELTPDIDFDMPEDDAPAAEPTRTTTAVREWLDAIPPMRASGSLAIA